MLIRFRDGSSFPSPLSMLDDFFSRDFSSFFGRDVNDWPQSNQGTAVPAVNIQENDQCFQIELAAPGLRKEDFRVNVEQNRLTISAQQETRSQDDSGRRSSTSSEGNVSTSGTGNSANAAAQASQTPPEGSASSQGTSQGQPGWSVQPQGTNQPQRYTRREFSYSSFQRSFSLPETVDADKISANYQNGILTVTVPKREQNQARLSRNIDIS